MSGQLEMLAFTHKGVDSHESDWTGGYSTCTPNNGEAVDRLQWIAKAWERAGCRPCEAGSDKCLKQFPTFLHERTPKLSQSV